LNEQQIYDIILSQLHIGGDFDESPSLCNAYRLQRI